MFRSRQGLDSLLGAHTSIRTATGVAWHPFSCPGSLRVVRAVRVCGSWSPWCLSPPRKLLPLDLLGRCAGHAEAGREPGSLCLPLAPAEAGALSSLRVVPVRGPAMGLSLAGPSGVGLRLRALRWFACVDPVTDASGFPYCPPFDGGIGGEVVKDTAQATQNSERADR